MRFDGNKLRDLRKARSWDQHRLAEAARQHQTGITQGAISRYENGMEPTTRNAMAIAVALEVDLSALMREDDAGDDEEAAPMDLAAFLVGQARMHAQQAMAMAEMVSRLVEQEVA